jgi:hypothetical protein
MNKEFILCELSIDFVYSKMSRVYTDTESLLRFYYRIGSVTGKNEFLVEGSSKVFYPRGPRNWLFIDANIGRWKFSYSSATDEVY